MYNILLRLSFSYACLLIQDLRQLDVNILTKYFMILAALEDNLNEYVSIQKDLKEVLDIYTMSVNVSLFKCVCVCVCVCMYI